MKEMRLTGLCRRLLLGLAFCAGMAGFFSHYIPQELKALAFLLGNECGVSHGKYNIER